MINDRMTLASIALLAVSFSVFCHIHIHSELIKIKQKLLPAIVNNDKYFDKLAIFKLLGKE
jgi:hypothetical protein